MSTPLEDFRKGLAALEQALEEASTKSDSLAGYTDFLDDLDPAVNFKLEDISYYLDGARTAIPRIRDMLLAREENKQDG